MNPGEDIYGSERSVKAYYEALDCRLGDCPHIKCPNEAQHMNPGVELDGLVATEVMKWKLVDGWWVRPAWKCIATRYRENDGLGGVLIYGDADRWKPSADIGVVWEVVEKMDDAEDSVYDMFSAEMEGAWFNRSSIVCGFICLAALKAVGYEI